MGGKNIGHFTVLKVEMLMQENRQSSGQRRPVQCDAALATEDLCKNPHKQTDETSCTHTSSACVVLSLQR